MSHTYPTLFKRDTTGKVRVWYMELDGDKHRSISGIQDGQLVESGWTTCTPKSKDTAEAQAEFEVEAEYRHKLGREYHASINSIDQPRFFKPMLAQKYEGWGGEACFAQPKLDGIRCIITNAGMFSREGKPILGAPHIREELHRFFDKNPAAILDGELYNHALKDDFNSIVSAVKKQKPTEEQLQHSREVVQYHVYDFPSVEGSFGGRYTALAPIIGGSIVGVPTNMVQSQEQLDACYAEWLEEGYEGQMVRLAGPYEQKRSKLLLKRKEMQDAEYPVVRIEEGNGNWAGAAKRVVCRLPDGREFGAGIKGTYDRGVELLTEAHDTVTVQFFALTPDGVPRFPVATKFHGTEGRL